MTVEFSSFTFETQVKQWLAILPLRPNPERAALPPRLHVALVDELYPVKIEEVYERVVTCLLDDTVPVAYRRAVVLGLYEMGEFSRAAKRMPPVVSQKELTDLRLGLETRLAKLVVELDFNPSVTPVVSEHLLALGQVLTLPGARIRANEATWKDWSWGLTKHLNMAFLLRGFVDSVEA